MASETTMKLFYMLGLIDKTSGPAKAVERRFLDLQRKVLTGTKELVLGAGAVGGAFLALNRFTGPGRELNKALDEVASLDVPQNELDKLGKASKQFARQFGGDAAAIARSAYDIQSAIPGLAEGALAAFTYNEALLTKAGKSNNATISAYFGTMYNIFEREAGKIGQAKWIDQLTGKTAEAIKIFKTSGDGMSQAFTNIGSTATEMGIALDEQLAVLGTLQATMGGAQAGTAYKGFVSKLAQGQQVLGISFKGADGQLLPVYDMLERIKKSVGNLDKDRQVARLTRAFGETGAQAVLNMMSKTEALKGNIEHLAKIQDASGAEKMATAMVDPYDKFLSTLKVVQTTLGQAILPAVNLAFGAVSGLLSAFQWLLEIFPPLRWAIAAVVLVSTALAISWGVLRLKLGIATLLEALTMKFKMMRAWIYLTHIATRQMTVTQQLAAVAQWAWSKSLGHAAIWTKVATVAQWLFNASLYGCPLVWVVGGIMLLIGAIALLIVYWDDVCAFVLKYADYLLMLLGPIGWVVAAFRNWDKITAFLGKIWNWFKKTCPNIANLIEKIAMVIGAIFKGVWNGVKFILSGIYDFFAWVFGGIADLAAGVWNGLAAGCGAAFAWIAGVVGPFFSWIGGLFDWLGSLGAMVWDGIAGMLSGIDGWIGKLLRMLAKIPGLGWLDPSVTADDMQSTATVAEVTPAGRNKDVAAGGVRSGDNNRTTNYGGVTINTTAFPGPGELEDWAALQA